VGPCARVRWNRIGGLATPAGSKVQAGPWLVGRIVGQNDRSIGVSRRSHVAAVDGLRRVALGCRCPLEPETTVSLACAGSLAFRGRSHRGARRRGERPASRNWRRAGQPLDSKG
jgi:hypothetical protein